MIAGNQRKYYMLGGKGGVGKTSCAASLAVKFANHGHPTIVVSTDPAHSLSDSFDQDLTGGTLVPIQGLDSPLFGLEINPEKTKEEFRSASQNNNGAGVKDFMDSMGLGMVSEQLGELKLAELLDTPPPGLDEAIAISKCPRQPGITECGYYVLKFMKEVIQGGVEVLKNNAIGCGKSSYTDADIDEVREDWASFVTIFVM